MKNIHPDTKNTTAECACGATYEIESTKENIEVEICSNCHPFYTGKEKIVDKMGRVEKFKKKMERAEKEKEEKKKREEEKSKKKEKESDGDDKSKESKEKKNQENKDNETEEEEDKK